MAPYFGLHICYVIIRPVYDETPSIAGAQQEPPDEETAKVAAGAASIDSNCCWMV